MNFINFYCFNVLKTFNKSIQKFLFIKINYFVFFLLYYYIYTMGAGGSKVDR